MILEHEGQKVKTPVVKQSQSESKMRNFGDSKMRNFGDSNEELRNFGDSSEELCTQKNIFSI